MELPQGTFELERVEIMEPEKEMMAAAMNESIRDDELQADNGGLPPAAAARPSLRTQALLEEAQEKEMLELAFRLSLANHQEQKVAAAQVSESLDTDSEAKPDSPQESRPSIRTQLLLEEEQEREMLEMAVRLSLSDNTDNAQSAACAVSLQEEELQGGTAATETGPSLRTLQVLLEENEKEMMELAIRNSMTNEDKNQMADPLEEEKLSTPQPQASSRSMRTQMLLEDEKEGEMLETAVRLSFGTNKQAAAVTSLQEEEPVNDTTTGTGPSLRTLQMLVEENEMEMMHLAIRNSMTNEDKNQVADTLEKFKEGKRSTPPEKEQEGEMLQRAGRLAEGANRQAAAVASVQEEEPPNDTATTETGPSLRTLQLLVEENEKEMIQLAIERSRRDSESATIGSGEHEETASNPQVPAGAVFVDDDDNFDILQVVRFRASQTHPLLVETQEKETMELSITTSSGGVKRADDVAGNDPGGHTRTTRSRERPGSPTKSPTTTTPIVPGEKQDDFHVMQIVHERARQAALEEASNPGLDKHPGLDKQASQEQREAPRRSSKERTSPAMDSVRPGAYSGAPGKELQRTSTLRLSFVGLASNRS